MLGLGRAFDVVCGWTPVDLNTANGATGKRVHLQNCSGLDIVVFKAAGTAGEDPSFDVQQHTLASGGSTQDLDVVDAYYLKREATLDGDETWERFAQTAASEVVDPGGATTSAEEEQILVIPVEASSLADGFEWVSLVCTVTAAAAQLGACLYILRDLTVQRAPQNLRNPQL